MNKIIQGDCLEVLKTIEDNSIDSICTDPPYGISFMGKKWDYDVPKIEVWKEVLRVLKPGGHALIACGTRTQHRMAVNLEDAGFEIRDIVAWVYGSGFPKSLNIGKAVDKLKGNERYVYLDKGKKFSGSNNNLASEGQCMFYRSKGNSPYEGWGTSLKPSMELWTLCRKPLEEKTVAENVLKYGTGGINIEKCRIKTNGEKLDVGGRGNHTRGDGYGFKPMGDYRIPENQGRFPANFCHDGSDEVVYLFPNDSQRFFYCAKASKSERNKGLEGFEEKMQGMSNGAQIHGEGYDKGQGIGLNVVKPMKNYHPTVKPVKLMQYLCRLITPKGGTVLDPFNGSGSTGIGAKLEGFNYVGIEIDPEYCKIAEARINAFEEDKQKTLL